MQYLDQVTKWPARDFTVRGGTATVRDGGHKACPPPTCQRWEICCELPATGDDQENVVEGTLRTFSPASFVGNGVSITNVSSRQNIQKQKAVVTTALFVPPSPRAPCQGHKPRSPQDSSKRVDKDEASRRD